MKQCEPLYCECWWEPCSTSVEFDISTDPTPDGWVYHALPMPSRWYCPKHSDRANKWREETYPDINQHLGDLLLHITTLRRSCEVN